MIVTQTSLQPEAIGVVAVLAVAVLSLLLAAVALVRSRRRRRARDERLRGDAPEPERFDGHTAEDVVSIADAGLYRREPRDVTDAALWLHSRDHPQALPYLLHALRLAPQHHRDSLIDAAATHPASDLADHPLLAAAIDPPVLTRLRDAVQARTAPAEPTPRRRVGRR